MTQNKRDKAIPVTFSIYESQIQKIKHLVRKKFFKNEAQAIQGIINFYFEKSKYENIKNFMYFLGYPLIIMTFCLYIATVANSAGQVLRDKNLYLHELTLISTVSIVFGFAFLSLTMGAVYWNWVKRKK